MKKKPGLPRTIPPYSIFLFLIFAFLFSLQVLPRFKTDSPFGDEVVDIGDGFYYWKGDVISDSHHPPLPKGLQTLPLWAMGLNSKAKTHFTSFERRDYNFLFVLNRDHFENIVAVGRGVTWLFGLGIGLLLFLIVRREPAGIFWPTMILWAFDPMLLAYSGIIMADVPVAFFFLVAVYSFQKMGEKFRWMETVRTGLLAGMAITAKFSAAVLVPVFFLLEAWRHHFRPGKWLKDSGKRWALASLTTFLWISLVYLPGTLGIPEFHWPFYYFWQGFSSTASYSGHPTYFCGLLSPVNHLAYYPLAFLLKSPLPFLTFLAAAAILAITKRLEIPAWQWLSPCLLFAAVLPFLNLGLRQVLPVYPFFILVAARGAYWLWSKSSTKMRWGSRITVGVLLFYQVVSVACSFPSQVSYFNEAVPEEKRTFFLGDSNLDVCQDTKRLAATARQKGWAHVKLAYFGVTDPAVYGMKWDYWREKDLSAPQPGWVYAVNVSFLQLGPAYFPCAAAINRSWISQRAPDGKVGATWYYFEIPGEASLRDSSPKLPSAPPFDYFAGLNQGP
jgi:hypothetical protein